MYCISLCDRPPVIYNKISIQRLLAVHVKPEASRAGPDETAFNPTISYLPHCILFLDVFVLKSYPSTTSPMSQNALPAQAHKKVFKTFMCTMTSCLPLQHYLVSSVVTAMHATKEAAAAVSRARAVEKTERVDCSQIELYVEYYSAESVSAKYSAKTNI
jgi:hypothetical protein